MAKEEEPEEQEGERLEGFGKGWIKRMFEEEEEGKGEGREEDVSKYVENAQWAGLEEYFLEVANSSPAPQQGQHKKIKINK